MLSLVVLTRCQDPTGFSGVCCLHSSLDSRWSKSPDRQELLAFLPSIVLLSLSATGNPHHAMGHINIIFIRTGCCKGSGGNHSLQDLSWILSILNLELKLTSTLMNFDIISIHMWNCRNKSEENISSFSFPQKLLLFLTLNMSYVCTFGIIKHDICFVSTVGTLYCYFPWPVNSKVL